MLYFIHSVINVSYFIIAGPKDSFGDLVGSMGMPAPVQPAPAANGETKLEEIDTNGKCFNPVMKLLILH